MEDRDVSGDDDVAGDARPAIFTFSVNHTDRQSTRNGLRRNGGSQPDTVTHQPM